MMPLLWLLAAAVLGAAAYLVTWPAWQSYRGREARDLHTERYLAWRGRAQRGATTSTREGMTGEERQRLVVGALLAAGAVAAILAFFVTS